MSESITFSIRMDRDLLDRIDESAERAGETRSTYILSWLPEFYDVTPRTRARNTQNPTDPAAQNHPLGFGTG